jgi:hypothetical protein
MPYSQDKHAILRLGINDPVVSYAKLEQSLELPGKGFTTIWVAG